MIDTFALSKTLVHPPDESLLIDNYWTPTLFDSTGVCFKFVLNFKGEGKPRLTITRRPGTLWTLRAEVSLGRWLYESNLHLVNEAELQHGLNKLSEYVEQKSGIAFDAYAARVSRVDFTQDIFVGEHAIIPVIEKFCKINVPKYVPHKISETTIQFTNGGKKRTKRFQIYGKASQMLKAGKNPFETEKARGILRLEVSLMNDAVTRLAKSLRLPDHCTRHIMTKVTFENVFANAWKRLNVETILNSNISDVGKFFETLPHSKACEHIAFLALRRQYGDALWNYPQFNLSKRTCQRRWKLCKDIGVMSLE
jgi:hypothetical protein